MSEEGNMDSNFELPTTEEEEPNSTTSIIPTDLSYISNRLQLIEPTILFNLIQHYTQSGHDANFLLIVDVRSKEQYTRDHIVYSIWCGPQNGSNCSIPYDVEFETLMHLVIIDNASVSNLDENSLACKYGIAIAPRLFGKVDIVMGGYERFSGEYPFLRTFKYNYTPLEISNLIRYPCEIVPLFLYIGDQSMMGNKQINSELKIKGQIYAFPKDEYIELKGISNQQMDLENTTDIIVLINECYDFIELYRNRAERVLISCKLGINASAIIACGYIMKKQHIGLLKAYHHLKKCYHSIRPSTKLLRALLEFEQTLFEAKNGRSIEKEVLQLARLEVPPQHL